MPEINIKFGHTLIEEQLTGEHCFNCGDVMFEKQFRGWVTCSGEPIVKHNRAAAKRLRWQIPACPPLRLMRLLAAGFLFGIT